MVRFLLDGDEHCHAARFLLAEWLEELGDSRAEGYLWLCHRGVVPQDYRGTHTWDWNDLEAFGRMAGALPHELFNRLTGGHLANTAHYREYQSRVEAEQALCDAILRSIPKKEEFLDK